MINKKVLGPLLAVVFVTVIVAIGYFIGRNVANAYNEKHKTKMTVFEILKEVTINKPLNYILVDKGLNLREICGKDTGICDLEAGIITLDNREIKLRVYSEFDNPDNLPTTYFKLNNTKIGSFVNLDMFEIFNNKYLMITETNSYNDNYVIHFYDKNGKEVSSYEATDINNGYEIKNNEIYYYYCNSADSNIEDEETLPRVSYFKVNASDITKKQEISFEYKKCV